MSDPPAWLCDFSPLRQVLRTDNLICVCTLLATRACLSLAHIPRRACSASHLAPTPRTSKATARATTSTLRRLPSCRLPTQQLQVHRPSLQARWETSSSKFARMAWPTPPLAATKHQPCATGNPLRVGKSLLRDLALYKTAHRRTSC